MKTIHLQSIGQHTAIEVKDVKVGDVLVWNFGSTSTVTAVKDISAKTRELTTLDNGKEYTRRFRNTTLVGFKSPFTTEAGFHKYGDFAYQVTRLSQTAWIAEIKPCFEYGIDGTSIVLRAASRQGILDALLDHFGDK